MKPCIQHHSFQLHGSRPEAFFRRIDETLPREIASCHQDVLGTVNIAHVHLVHVNEDMLHHAHESVFIMQKPHRK